MDIHRSLYCYTVCLFGHRHLDITPEVENRFEKNVRSLLREKEYVEFLIGRDGDFDIWAASVIKSIQESVRSDNSSLTWVMPYIQSQYSNDPKSMEAYYSHIEICQTAAESHFKQAFSIRNKEMVDRADLVLVCMEKQSGGVFQTVEYAIKTNKPVLNLCRLHSEFV